MRQFDVEDLDIPDSHPRARSLRQRAIIRRGISDGITSLDGACAQGRGEAFDYLIGEKTWPFAERACEAAANLMLQARHPVISVNGNAAVLAPEDLVEFSSLTGAPLEVNIFHSSEEREKRIHEKLISAGAKRVLMPLKEYEIPGLESNRRFVNPEGLFKADVIFVPLEDGDRAEALITAGRKVIAVDLNPASRTSKICTVTIVDNLVRALPLINQKVRELKAARALPAFDFNNQENLLAARQCIVEGFAKME